MRMNARRTGRRLTWQVVGGKLKDGEAPTSEILLIAKVLIRSDEDVEFLLCQTD